ncbi:hypothetical protein Syun_010167 [Stephania yunnanensis]|uniref:Uncharacterized protein n=1 Tax=Stephania yunnanensis TaxID=152371 RepID=A0AAP0KFZ0_9MAGN
MNTYVIRSSAVMLEQFHQKKVVRATSKRWCGNAPTKREWFVQQIVVVWL